MGFIPYEPEVTQQNNRDGAMFSAKLNSGPRDQPWLPAGRTFRGDHEGLSLAGGISHCSADQGRQY